MIREITTKPIIAKNGDKWMNPTGKVFEMRYGTWIKVKV